MFPVDAGQDPETLRRHTFKVAEALPMPAAVKPATPAAMITLTLDSTFIRSCEDSERHLEVRIGNVETTTGRRQVFGAVAKADTDLATLIRGNLDAVGRTKNTALTAFTDGCSGLRRAESNGRRNTWRKGLRWALGSGARIGPGEVPYGRRVGQGWRGVRIGGGSGRQLRRAWRVRKQRAARVCRRR